MQPSVWLLFDQHQADAAIAAALGLRRAANEHRCRGQRREADEFDELADDLERIIVAVHLAYRAAHPPPETSTTGPQCDGEGPAVSTESEPPGKESG